MLLIGTICRLISCFMQVILGGGRRHWLPKVARDPEQTMEEGRRLDGRNLIDDWLRDKKKKNLRAEYVWNKQQLEAVSVASTDYLLGMDICKMQEHKNKVTILKFNVLVSTI